MKSTLACIFLIIVWILPNSAAQAQPFDTKGIIQDVGSVLFPGVGITDVWYWQDPVSLSEYAIVGWHGNQGSTDGGFYVVNFDDPASPYVVSQVESRNGFDMKVWKSYVYAVNGSSGTGTITDISDPEHPMEVGTFPSSHNIYIDDQGYMCAESPVTRIFDLNQTPTSPQLIWTGESGGHDCLMIGDRFYSFHGGTGTFIYDFTDRSNPELLSAIQDPTITYHHSGWTTEDGRFLFITDELAEHPAADITVWDLVDVTRPVKVAAVAYPNATIHNLMIKGDLAYLSYYNDGFRVLDISNPYFPVWMGEFDINGDILSGEGYSGAWGVYPFTSSGYILISGRTFEGGALYIFDAQKPVVGTESETEIPGSTAILEAYPNPFQESLHVTIQIEHSESVEVAVFDMLGRKIDTLLAQNAPAGLIHINWVPHTSSSRDLATGTYIVKMTAGDVTRSRMVSFIR